MSNKATTWAYSLRLGKSSAKFVLACLADKADESHSCYPGVGMIAAETELSVRSVKDQLAFLERAGLITRRPRMVERYTASRPGLLRRTSDRYVLPVGMTQEQLDARLQALMDGRSSAALPLDDAEVTESAEFAPSVEDDPVDNSTGTEDAEFAPSVNAPVDNSPVPAAEGATGATEGANERRVLKEEPSGRTIRSSSSTVNTTTYVAKMVGTDDDGKSSHGAAGGHEPGWLSHLATTLREIHAALDLDQLLRRLAAAHLTTEALDLVQAAVDVIAAAPRMVGDASAYLAASIIREPGRWLAAGPARDAGLPPRLPVSDARVQADVRSAKARRLIDADWPSRMPLHEDIAVRLAAARQAERAALGA